MGRYIYTHTFTHSNIHAHTHTCTHTHTQTHTHTHTHTQIHTHTYAHTHTEYEQWGKEALGEGDEKGVMSLKIAVEGKPGVYTHSNTQFVYKYFKTFQ
jgi:hypothetical protein